MSLSTILQTAAVCSLLLGWGWLTKDYEFEHKPQAQAKWAYIEFLQCVESCHADKLAMCRQLKPDATEEECAIECPRCEKFKERE